IRLPLQSGSKRKGLRRNEKFFENDLTRNKAAVECAASVETKGSVETLFNNLNQAIRVGACDCKTDSQQIISITSNTR
ncbi:hypothetical protein, partial [Stutzerimonas kirkiae]|uniref:hypothetical protein n=1 Tax=Stutzerimonas kirkiae TaxID=2211392 RepID=UPI001A95532A